MNVLRTLAPGLALPVLLVTACVADDDASPDPDEAVASAAAALTSAPPSFTDLTSTPGAMHLTFATNDPATTRLVVYKMDRNAGYYERLGGVPLDPSGQYGYDDQAAVLGHEYCYKIGSYADGQQRAVESAERCAFHTGGTQPLPPTAPANLRLEHGYERVLDLAFQDASSDETSFVVERRSGVDWHPVATLPAAAGTGGTGRFSDYDLDIEQTYCYRVRAIGANGSSLSNTICPRTSPLAVGQPLLVSSDPKPVTLTHPRSGSLSLTWVDDPSFNEWRLITYDGLTSTVLGDVTVSDRGPVPRFTTVRRKSFRFDNLEPGKLYCFKVTHGGTYGEMLCESPSAERATDDKLDPRPEQTPTITAVNAPVNGRLDIVVSNPQPGQVLERVTAATGAREDLQHDTAGAARLSDTRAFRAGATYCYRLFVFNSWGARYSNTLCGATTASLPGTPGHLHVHDRYMTTVGLDWDNATNADSYELSYHGERPATTDHDGTRTTDLSGYNFEGYEGFTYCFKVRARNAFGASGWSNELCGVTIADDHLVTYYTLLAHEPPTEGNALFYHNVDAGLGPQAHLVKVDVIGNGFTGYRVHFLPPQASRQDCGNGNVGAIVEPGHSLTGADLARVYGTSEPPLPLGLLACKLLNPGSPLSLDDMPINVTYRQ